MTWTMMDIVQNFMFVVVAFWICYLIRNKEDKR